MIADMELVAILQEKAVIDPGGNGIGKMLFCEVRVGVMPEGVIAYVSEVEFGFLCGLLYDRIDPISPAHAKFLRKNILIDDEARTSIEELPYAAVAPLSRKGKTDA